MSVLINSNNKLLPVIVAVLIAASVFIIPYSDSSGEGKSVIFSLQSRSLAAIFIFTLILWATETFPIAITALLAIVLQPLLGVNETRDAFAAFMSPVFFFVIAMFIIAGCITESRLDKRFALFLLHKAGTKSTRILLALMIGTAVLSSIMSDVPACAVFMTIALGIISKSQVQQGQSNFAKALMIGIPISALIGGVATPAGSSINVLALDLLEVFAQQHELDIQVTFIQWMALGVPMAIVLVPLSWSLLIWFYPPEIEQIGSESLIISERQQLGVFSKPELKVITILLIMMVCWIAGSWIKPLNVAVVALLGAIIMFMPGINLITWEKAEQYIGWDVLLIIGSVTSLGQASVKTGLADWLVQATMSGISDWPLLWLISFISLLTVIIHLPLPIAPVVNAVLIPPIAALALSMNIDPVILVLPVAFTASCAFLLPLDAVPLITYAKGYYRMLDMLKPGLMISFAWIIIMTVVMLWIAPLVQLY